MNHASSSSSSSSRNDASVDEMYFSALFDYDELFPISDESYAMELHLQEALVSSLSRDLPLKAENLHHNNVVGVAILSEKKIKTEPETTVKTEPEEPSRRFCIICMEEKSSSDIFRGTTSCTHSYCTDCTASYVAIKIRESSARIKCPAVECTQLLEPYTCRNLVPRDVFERWEDFLCESLILASERVYCPHKDCSALMVEDGGNTEVTVTATECPRCHRLFCAQCKVTWHAGIGCDEFRRSGNGNKVTVEEQMVMEMAKAKSWRRCPNCKFYVEKVYGCLHISCRCGCEFCYGCGSLWHAHGQSCNPS
ncbi:PREDICTED: probable E3 ubiquitin-protein ligase RNF217 [Tarenaya hassleriana]|uniref:probable E3 ubiquitin-protein ligase RNF217 n=1 Tax=Tarenaya hassleriana TaxID=28532 RepID=UPI0008FCE38A|nr:PREDICTED: probable E3 ubiquitin-protein ligase RNF217 [Tarenaya hassleriana]